MGRKFLSEFIGTYMLVFCGTGAIVINNASGALTHVGIAATFGLIVLAMIYAFGDVSGAHMNPAVSIAFSLSGRLPYKELLFFIAAQLSGAIFASGTLAYLFPSDITLGATIPAGSEIQSFILEFIMSFLLMFVILSVSTGAKEKGITAGIAVSSVVLLEAMFGGPVSGASMNPARSLAPAFVSGHTEHLRIYLVSPILAMMFASLVFRLMQPKTT